MASGGIRAWLPSLDLKRDMAAKPKVRPKGQWTPEELARNERVTSAQVARDRARGVSAKLEVPPRHPVREPFAPDIRHVRGA